MVSAIPFQGLRGPTYRVIEHLEATSRWLERGQEVCYRLLQPGQVTLDRVPDDLEIDAEVLVVQQVPHRDDVRPGNVRRGAPDLIGERPGDRGRCSVPRTRWPPGCPGAGRGLFSQGPCFPQDVLTNSRPQGAPADHVHSAAEPFLERPDEGGVVQEGEAGVRIHQEIDVAVPLSSPRATDPNTWTFRAPCSWTMRRISPRNPCAISPAVILVSFAWLVAHPANPKVLRVIEISTGDGQVATCRDAMIIRWQ